MQTIDTPQHVATGLAALKSADPRLVAVAEAAGPLPLRRRPGGFGGIAAIIVSQQLSRASADAIHGRLAARFDPLTASAVSAASDEDLAATGLSRPKIRAMRAVAGAVEAGEIDLDGLALLDDEDVIRELCRIKGIGPWTADIYLLACLGRADVFPARDLALQEAARVALGLQARPTEGELLAEAEIWRPWRSIAAVLLWAFYRHVRRETGATDREQGGVAQ